jgi:GNAT superfamily N-acetyltransferase
MADLHLLTMDDLPAALRLAQSAGWNQTLEDWRRFLALEPEGCFGIEEDGRLVATAAIVCHGWELAWIAMVITHPDYRRRGLARRLVEATLAVADARGIPTVKLDASDAGRPLYLELGFVDEQPTERWHRVPVPLQAQPVSFSIGPPDAVLDRAAFGVDRLRSLSTLGPVCRFETGFLMHRPGCRARYLGPCVARDGTAAERAIRAVVSAHATEPWLWDMIPANRAAGEIARRLGFATVRHLTRMRRGVPIATRDDLVYAVAGFEVG